jgi:hypothetical protein
VAQMPWQRIDTELLLELSRLVGPGAMNLVSSAPAVRGVLRQPCRSARRALVSWPPLTIGPGSTYWQQLTDGSGLLAMAHVH